jgi:hypothetical protein
VGGAATLIARGAGASVVRGAGASALSAGALVTLASGGVRNQHADDKCARMGQHDVWNDHSAVAG